MKPMDVMSQATHALILEWYTLPWDSSDHRILCSSVISSLYVPNNLKIRGYLQEWPWLFTLMLLHLLTSPSVRWKHDLLSPIVVKFKINNSEVKFIIYLFWSS